MFLVLQDGDEYADGVQPDIGNMSQQSQTNSCDDFGDCMLALFQISTAHDWNSISYPNVHM